MFLYTNRVQKNYMKLLDFLELLPLIALIYEFNYHPGSAAAVGQPAVSAVVEVGVWGVRVRGAGLRMSHALRRISFATCDAPRALFAFVAREPRDRAHAHYCHAFETEHPHQAEELNTLVGDAFRMAFASQLQPSAPLWSKEVSGGPRAPDSLPGLAHHYPRCHSRSPARCGATGGENAEGSASEGSEGSEASEGSPSSSEDWVSPGDPSRYRRLAERPPLMKRLALGLSGALLQPSDDDATPLVTDTPTTPTNAPLCLNGGYINEATEAARRAASGRCPEFRRGDALSDGRGGGSAAASSSSGESSGGASRESRESRGSGNNNFRPVEPELKNAPWFQQGIPREIALEVLSAQAPGAFLVRASTTQAECLALSLRVPRDFAAHGIAHYLILRTPKGYKIKGFTKEFGSLAALVTHHSVMPELLPVPLRLPRAPPRPRADLEPLERLAPPPSPHPAPPAPPVRCADFL
ncbi:tensin-like isoform X2 [Pieris brassicae]|uniref:tensin-like isoform X2 n=2 Tax=Pieris brassicae TaxID=7116 RepID=UPI001E662565|nr:tensin-like isoform X2 [Pieris brassicae]